MTEGRSVLEQVAQKLDENPIAAAELALGAQREGRDGDWSDEDRKLVASAYLNAAQELAFVQGPAEEVRRQRAQAIRWLVASAQEFIKVDDRIGAAEMLEEAGQLAFSIHALDEAEDAFVRASTLASEAGDEADDIRASSLSRLGTLRLSRGDLDGARSAYAGACSAFESVGDRRGMANALGALGDVATRSGEQEAAFENYERSLDILQEIGDPRGQAHAHKALGTLHTHSENDEEAHLALTRALELFREAWDRVGEGNTYQALGNLVAGDPDQATSMYREALANHAIASDLRGMAGDFGYLGRAASRCRRFAQAVALFERSLALHLRVGAHREAILNLVDQSKALLELEGHTAASLACLRMAIDVGGALDGFDTTELIERSKTILERIAAREPSVAKRLEAALDENAAALKTKGIVKLFEEPALAVMFFDDMLVTAEVLEDYDEFLGALIGQARAFHRVGKPEAMAASVEVAAQAIVRMPQERQKTPQAMLDAVRKELGVVAPDTALEDAETQRFRAVEDVRRGVLEMFPGQRDPEPS